jgi:flagellar biogenesis protein FliO
MNMDLARQLMSVLLVLGLLAAALWWLRQKGGIRITGRAGRGGRQRHVVLVERVSLTPQHAIHLIHVGDRALLVGTGPSGCGLIEGLAWKDLQTGCRPSGLEPVER